MATFRRFEDIQAWQKARVITQNVYRITANGSFAKDYGLRDQLRRASVSIMANIAEGFARRSDRDFANFLNISRSSTAEVQSHLYVALDQKYMSQADFDELYLAVEKASKMIFALARHLIARAQ